MGPSELAIGFLSTKKVDALSFHTIYDSYNSLWFFLAASLILISWNLMFAWYPKFVTAKTSGQDGPRLPALGLRRRKKNIIYVYVFFIHETILWLLYYNHIFFLQNKMPIIFRHLWNLGRIFFIEIFSYHFQQNIYRN